MQLTIVDKLKQWLDKKSAAIVCLLVAVVSKSVIELSYSSLTGDKSLYLLFTKAFLETGVLAEPVKVFENGNSYYLYNPAIHSPLYSVIAAPFLWLTNSYFFTQYILSVISWIIFFTALYQLCKLVFKQRWIAVLFLLFSAFFLYPHELSSTPKDTFAIGFVLWSLVLIRQLQVANPGWVQAALLGLTITCLASIKLLYIPVAIVLALAAIVIFLKQKKTHLLATAVFISTAFGLCFLLYFLVFQPAYGLTHPSIQLSQNSTNTNGGFHPSNLQYTFPFITSSFVNTHLWAVQIEKLTALSFTDVMQVFFRIDVLLFFGLIGLLYFFRRLLVKNPVLLLLVCVSATIVAVVVGLSLNGQGTVYKSSSAFWTFVMDARSFLLPMITFQIVLFLFIFQLKKLSFLRMIALGVLFINSLHGVYFTAKETASLKPGRDSSSEDAQTRIVSLIMAGEDWNTTSLITSDHFLRRYAQVNGLNVYSFSNQVEDFSWMRKGDRFLVATFPEDSSYRKKFPPGGLILADTIRPFVVHQYIAP